jgi:hypothetical protein
MGRVDMKEDMEECIGHRMEEDTEAGNGRHMEEDGQRLEE